MCYPNHPDMQQIESRKDKYNSDQQWHIISEKIIVSMPQNSLAKPKGFYTVKLYLPD
jgi:hypothetical protein